MKKLSIFVLVASSLMSLTSINAATYSSTSTQHNIQFYDNHKTKTYTSTSSIRSGVNPDMPGISISLPGLGYAPYMIDANKRSNLSASATNLKANGHKHCIRNRHSGKYTTIK